MRVCMERTFGKGLLPIAAVIFTMLSGLSATTTESIAADRELWVYCPANFLVESECERVHKILEQAARAGYTHALISDSKFSRLHEMDQRYFKHIAALKAKAAQLKLVLVPACCPVGYSNDLLAQNPNLAEALPVKQSSYTVKNGFAFHTPDPNVELPALADRKKWGFIDECFVASENGLVAEAPFGSHARVMKKINTQKFQQYHASVWIKTEDFTPAVEVKVLSPQGDNLCFTYLKSKPTQDWTQHHVTFNSLDNDQLNFYIGVWGPKTGKLWIKDAKLESTGAVNLVRRDTAPIEVKSINGNEEVLLKEGLDFEPWQDPKLGNIPYRGEYEAWHEPPPIQLKRKLPDGSRLKVTYYHTHIIHDGQVCGAIGDAEFESLLKQQATAVAKLIPTNTYMMSHDEYRVMGWTRNSIEGLSDNASPGDLLTHNAKVCRDAISQVAPTARVITWSDMFDPHHNAVAKYYLVNGSLESARLPRQVWVMNWNSGKKLESLKHFERLGHHQIIAGYYDEAPNEINNWLDTVVNQKVANVNGVMYTTWTGDYSQLDSFATKVKSHRWYQQRN